MDEKTIKEAGYIAVNKDIAEAGCIAWWRLSGDVDLAQLGFAWAERGLEAAWLPSAPSARVALRRAMGELGERRLLVRPLEGDDGFALVREAVVGDELAYGVELRASVDESDALSVEPPDHPLAAKLGVEYAANLGRVTQADVGGWLAKLVDRVDAVALRDTGGVYFVPRHGLDLWRRAVGALRACSANAVLGVPAMPVEDTVAAVVDAVTAEAEREARVILEEVSGGDLGERALENRMRRANLAEEKLVRYEGILGQRLDAVRDRLMEARAAASAAALAAAPQEGLFQ